VRAYPHVFFGTAAEFKTRSRPATSGLVPFTPFTPRTAERMVQMVGERTHAAAHTLTPAPLPGGSVLPLNPSSPPASAPTLALTAAVAAATAAAATDSTAADLEDIEYATVLAYEQMTSPALLVPKSRGAFLEFTQLLAVVGGRGGGSPAHS
jgi:hypothetical protein